MTPALLTPLPPPPPPPPSHAIHPGDNHRSRRDSHVTLPRQQRKQCGPAPLHMHLRSAVDSGGSRERRGKGDEGNWDRVADGRDKGVKRDSGRHGNCARHFQDDLHFLSTLESLDVSVLPHQNIGQLADLGHVRRLQLQLLAAGSQQGHVGGRGKLHFHKVVLSAVCHPHLHQEWEQVARVHRGAGGAWEGERKDRGIGEQQYNYTSLQASCHKQQPWILV